MTRFVRLLLIAGLVFIAAGSARAEPPAPMEDRVSILDVEMNRVGANKLAPYLKKDAHPRSRWYALRALGRIGEDDPAAIDMLKAYLSDGYKVGGLLDAALWCAGIAQSKDLADSIRPHLKSKTPEVVAAAAEAMGWTGAPGAAKGLSALLEVHNPIVQRGALMGLARSKDDGYLERVLSFMDKEDEGIQDAAAFGAWLLTGARRKAATDFGRDDYDAPELAARLISLLDGAKPKRTMAILRSLSSMVHKKAGDEILDTLHGTPSNPKPYEPLFGLADHSDPRVVQDFASRILAKREGTAVEGALAKLLQHADPKVRALAARAIVDKWSDTESYFMHATLIASFREEKDPRVLEQLAIALAKTFEKTRDKNGLWTKWSTDKARLALGRVDGPDLGPGTMSVLLADKNNGVSKLLKWLDEHPKAHAINWMTATSELEAKQDNAPLKKWLEGKCKDAATLFALDPYVAASIVSLACEVRAWPAIQQAFAFVRSDDLFDSPEMPHEESEMTLASKAGDLVMDKACPEQLKSELTSWLRGSSASKRSAWVARAAKKSLESAKLEVPKPLTKIPVNGWRGLPRPKTALLGFDPSKGDGAWLSSKEILQLADAIRVSGTRIKFETSQGTFVVSVDPEAAPVHSVSVVLAAHAGLYNNTRWHRVVPNFVIQGGDPHGHGAGNGGWTVPDEITRLPFARGALGMPKSQKDDGGCQLFFMHSSYMPLDGRYTCYGKVDEGMDVVDRIRVGDKILKATLVGE